MIDSLYFMLPCSREFYFGGTELDTVRNNRQNSAENAAKMRNFDAGDLDLHDLFSEVLTREQADKRPWRVFKTFHDRLGVFQLA